MDKIMEKSFDALEAALTQLIESISSYNPSPIAASAVVLADNDISENLELLAEHQANHHKIQSLRATSEALDQRLTQLFSALAQTRKELLTVPSTKFPPAREVPYEELLTYARKISKYTVPPNVRFPQPPLPQATLSGNALPAEQLTTNIGLTNEEAAALDPSSRVVFAPWPSEEIMRRGALAQITFAGEGIITNKPLEQSSNGADREVEVKAEQAGGSEPLNGGAGGASQTGQSYPARDLESARRREEQRNQAFFGLDLYDPDED